MDNGIKERNRRNSANQREAKDAGTRERQNNILNSFRRRVEDYFQMVLRVLRDLIPKNIGYFLVMESQRGMQF